MIILCDGVGYSMDFPSRENSHTRTYTHTESCMPDRIAVDLLPEALGWLAPTLAQRLCPAIETAFPGLPEVTAQNLRLYQATVLRYDASTAPGPVSTPVHQDFSVVTMTIPLNDPMEYDGGGTWINPLHLAVKPPIGHALAHAGRVWHAGQPVTNGTRYALAMFFHSSGHVDHGRRFEQRATSLIAKKKIVDACEELTFSLRAYSEAVVSSSLDRGGGGVEKQGIGIGSSIAPQATLDEPKGEDDCDEDDCDMCNHEGQSLWGVLANLHLQLGQVEEALAAEPHFLKHIERLRLPAGREGGQEHPELAGSLHNLELLHRRKTLLASSLLK